MQIKVSLIHCLDVLDQTEKNIYSSIDIYYVIYNSNLIHTVGNLYNGGNGLVENKNTNYVGWGLYDWHFADWSDQLQQVRCL